MAGRVAGRGAELVGDFINQKRIPVPGMGNAAAMKLTDDVAAAGGAQAVTQRLDELGPGAMLLDASPSFQGRAQGLAIHPATREQITGPLVARNQGTNARLNQTLDTTLGPAVVPSQTDAAIKATRRGLGAEYEASFQNARAVDTQPLANALETAIVGTKGETQGVLQRVRDMLDIHGAPGTLDPDPRTLLATRQEIDGMRKGITNDTTLRALETARNAVDAELRRAVPGIKAVDAQYAELSRQRDALTRGGQLFDGGKTAIRPQELGPEIAASALPQGQMIGPSAAPMRLRQGARAELDRVVGTNANDLVAVRNFVKGEGDWNQTKLAQVFGDDNARAIIGSVDRETAFRNAYEKIVQNSQTAQREAAAAGTAVRGEGDSAGMQVSAATGGISGLAAAGAVKGVSKAGGLLLKDADLARNREIASALLLEQSPQLAAVVQALGRRAATQGTSRAVGAEADKVVRALLASQGGRISDLTFGRSR
jgi:hypothetical protein